MIDLVREVGIDVSDWANSTRGVQGASTNPRFCYEWAFTGTGKSVALNLWHSELIEREGFILREGNFREDAIRHRENGRREWASRALRCDRALKLAIDDDLAVRVILNAGVKQQLREPNARASVVKLRELDPATWRIIQYSEETGAFTLRRGATAPQFIDQHDIGEELETAVIARAKSGEVFVRSQAVRSAVLARAQGRCEHCRTQGFLTPAGSIYLETHHIVPLSEGGADSTRNVIALCPNDHRRAHHSADRLALRNELQANLRR